MTPSYSSPVEPSAPVTVKDGSSGSSLQVCGRTSGSLCAGKLIILVILQYCVK